MQRNRYVARAIACIALYCGCFSACTPPHDDANRDDATRDDATRDSTASDSVTRDDTARGATYDVNGAPIHIERSRYLAQVIDTPYRHVVFDIPMVFVNKSSDTVYLLGCGHPTMPILQKRVGDDWVMAYAAIELQCLSPAWRIHAGGTFRDTFRIHGVLSGPGVGEKLDLDVNGTYRLLRQVYADPVPRRLLPETLRISDTFGIDTVRR